MLNLQGDGTSTTQAGLPARKNGMTDIQSAGTLRGLAARAPYFHEPDLITWDI
jgi:hypothetical protein